MSQKISEFLSGWLFGNGGHSRGTFVTTDIVRITGGNGNAAILFSQILYWNTPSAKRECKIATHKHGKYWLAKRYEDWEEETGINACTARNGIKRLKAQGLIETKVMKWAGNPTVHIALCYEALENKLIELYNPCPEPNDQLGSFESTSQVVSKRPNKPVPLTEITTEITEYGTVFPEESTTHSLFDGSQELRNGPKGWVRLPKPNECVSGLRELMGKVISETMVAVKTELALEYSEDLGLTIDFGFEDEPYSVSGLEFDDQPWDEFLGVKGAMSARMMRSILVKRGVAQVELNRVVSSAFWEILEATGWDAEPF